MIVAISFFICVFGCILFFEKTKEYMDQKSILVTYFAMGKQGH